MRCSSRFRHSNTPTRGGWRDYTKRMFSSLTVASQRVLEPELMDDPALESDQHRQALDGLTRINRVSNTAARMARTINTLNHHPDQPLRILDVATGSGDLPLSLAARAQRRGWNWQLVGSDISPTAISYAQERATKQKRRVEFITHNAIETPLPDDCDVIACSLFLHHLTDDEAVTLLSRMRAAARQMVIVDDLSRSNWGLLLAVIGTRLLSRSPIVHVDGPRSVRAAFTPLELSKLADQADLDGHRVTTNWPARQLLVWRRS